MAIHFTVKGLPCSCAILKKDGFKSGNSMRVTKLLKGVRVRVLV